MVRSYLKRDFIYDVPGRESLSKRGIQHASTTAWNKKMAEKQSKNEEKIDGQNMWYVNGNVYNLTKFIDKHPGGKKWLELTQGQDITESYITHHINQKRVNQILEKYYVGKQKDFKPRYTFREGDFYMTVQKRIFDKLGDKFGYNKESIINGILIFAIWALLFYLMCIYRSKIIAVIAGYLLFSVMGIGHNFFHQKDTIFKYFWDFSNFHHIQWTTSHIISHHALPNTEQDIEISSFEPFLSSLTSQKQIKSRTLSIINFIIVGFMLSIGSFITDILNGLKYRNIRPEQLIPLLELVIIYFTGPKCCKHCLLSESIILWAIMHGTSSIVMVTATFLSHRTERDWQAGDMPICDFGEHIVYTAHDHDVNLPSFLSFLIYGGFNDHIVHHLFPTMDKCHFYKCREIILQTIKEFKLDYKTYSYLEGTSSVFDNYARKRPSERKQLEGINELRDKKSK